MFRIIAIFLTLSLAGTASALAKRVALVIGNGAYTNAVALPNPVNDATAMSGKLRDLGFEVYDGYDLDLVGMRKTVAEFARNTRGSDIALLFYAGHGMQVGGQNYLIPVDAKMKDETALDFETMSVDFVLRQMTFDVKVQMVMLDACRDNPLARTLARTMGPSRSAVVGQGLAEVKLQETGGEGSVIAFATSPGDVALDGEEQNSPFTRALLKHIDAPNASIQTVMTRVTGEVYKETGQRQRPWVNASLIGEVFLNKREDVASGVQVASVQPSAPVAPAASAPTAAQSGANAALIAWEREKALWDAAVSTGTSVSYEAYISAYPAGAFAAIAKEKIAHLSTNPPISQPVMPSEPTLTAEDKQLAGSQFTESRMGWNRTDRREVQARLNLADFNVGKPDGAFGPRTRSGIAAWQGASGFLATGYFTEPQYRLLVARTEAQYVVWLEEEEKRRATAAVSNRSAGGNAHRRNNNGAASNFGAALMGGVIGGVIGGALSR